MKNQFSDVTTKHIITAIVLILICGGAIFTIHFLVTKLDQDIAYLKEPEETSSVKKEEQESLETPIPSSAPTESIEDVITANIDDKGGVISVSKDDLEPISIDAYNAILEGNKNDKLYGALKQLNIDNITLNGVWIYYRENLNDEKAVMSFKIDGEKNAFILTSYDAENDIMTIMGAGTYSMVDGKMHLKYQVGEVADKIKNPIVIDSFTEKYFTSSDGDIFIKK